MTVYVAIDSGGTRTTIAVSSDSSDHVLDSTSRFEALTGILEKHEYGTTLQTIFTAVAQLLERLAARHEIGADEPVVAFIAAAGFAVSTRKNFDGTLEGLWTRLLTPKPLRALGICNDAVALLLGHDVDLAVIAGTGSNVLVREAGPEPRIHQVGGHNWVASDNGSGFQVGMRGIRQAMRDHEEAQDTTLLGEFKQCYAVDDPDDFIRKMESLSVADSKMKGRIAKFARSVCESASRDRTSQRIVEEEARDLAELTAIAVRRHTSAEQMRRGLSVAQSGSLFQSAYYRKAFEDQVKLRLGSDVASLNWHNFETGTEAVMKLAVRIRDPIGGRELLSPEEKFRPLIYR